MICMMLLDLLRRRCLDFGFACSVAAEQDGVSEKARPVPGFSGKKAAIVELKPCEWKSIL